MTDTAKTAAEFDAALDAFCARILELRTGAAYERETVSVMRGRKYARIVLDNGSQRFAHAFVNLANGDILKPDGWKRPAKHARGSIFTPDAYGLTPHGHVARR